MLIAAVVRKVPEFQPLSEDNAMGTIGQELRTKTERELEKAVNGSVFWAATLLLTKAQSKLMELSTLKSNWDSYGAPAPNDVALHNAIRILELMHPFDLAIASIVPSAEGGIGFCFAKEERYADIESTNGGEILGVRYVGVAAPVLIQATDTDVSIRTALEEVRNHING
jgi:hypothetical protein